MSLIWAASVMPEPVLTMRPHPALAIPGTNAWAKRSNGSTLVAWTRRHRSSVTVSSVEVGSVAALLTKMSHRPNCSIPRPSTRRGPGRSRTHRRSDLGFGAVVHHDLHPAREDVAEMDRLAAIGFCDRFDVPGRSPAGVRVWATGG